MAALFVRETKPSTPSSPPRDFSTPLRGAQPETIDAHYHAIRAFELQCAVPSMNSDLPLDHPQIFCRASPRSTPNKG
jgi:hypothetical protein